MTKPSKTIAAPENRLDMDDFPTDPLVPPETDPLVPPESGFANPTATAAA